MGLKSGEYGGKNKSHAPRFSTASLARSHLCAERLSRTKVNVDSLLNDDGSFSIFISDTGYGMNDADVATAMSVFGQVDSGHNRMHEGTGSGRRLSNAIRV